jgi:probable F420-dependent oxidoreductase
VTPDIGRIGTWSPLALWGNEPDGGAAAAAELEELGYGAIWLGNGPTILDTVATLLAATDRITVATGVLNVWAHEAEHVAGRFAGLATAHPHRVLLGLGSGPRDATQTRSSAYRKMTGYLDELDALGIPAGQRVLGALGPQTLTLAAARSAGAHPFLTTPEHTRDARHRLGPGALLAVEQRFVLDTDAMTAREIARDDLEFYLPKPGYRRTLQQLGFTDEDFLGGGSDRLVDALVVHGDADAVLARVQAHLAAGADHVAVQPLTPDTHIASANRMLPREQFRLLAAALPPSRLLENP